MKTNILSLGQLLEKVYDIHMRNQSLSKRDQHANLIANVLMTSNRMFLLNIKNNCTMIEIFVLMILLGFYI